MMPFFAIREQVPPSHVLYSRSQQYAIYTSLSHSNGLGFITMKHFFSGYDMHEENFALNEYAEIPNCLVHACHTRAISSQSPTEHRRISRHYLR